MGELVTWGEPYDAASKVGEVLAAELCTIVRDDNAWNPVGCEYTLYVVDGLRTGQVGQQLCLDPP